MERVELDRRLADARHAVTEGDTNIQHQRDLILRLRTSGRDTSMARAVLDALLKRQAERHAILGHILRQLSLGS